MTASLVGPRVRRSTSDLAGAAVAEVAGVAVSESTTALPRADSRTRETSGRDLCRDAMSLTHPLRFIPGPPNLTLSRQNMHVPQSSSTGWSFGSASRGNGGDGAPSVGDIPAGAGAVAPASSASSAWPVSNGGDGEVGDGDGCGGASHISSVIDVAGPVSSANDGGGSVGSDEASSCRSSMTC